MLGLWANGWKPKRPKLDQCQKAARRAIPGQRFVPRAAGHTRGQRVATLTGGDKFNRAMALLARRVAKPATMRVGFLENATYPNGLPVAMIAAINEFGAPARGQPPRPFFRNMIAAKKDEWPDAIAGVLKANDFDAAKTLDITGAAIEGQLRQSIVDLVSPPLAKSTIRRKGFDKPLIDTGHMLKSVDHDVKT